MNETPSAPILLGAPLFLLGEVSHGDLLDHLCRYCPRFFTADLSGTGGYANPLWLIIR